MEGMSNIISLGKARSDRDKPDPEFVGADQYGRPMTTFVFDYKVRDKDFSFRVMAYDFEDAEAHCRAIRDTAFVAGIVMTEVMA